MTVLKNISVWSLETSYSHEPATTLPVVRPLSRNPSRTVHILHDGDALNFTLNIGLGQIAAPIWNKENDHDKWPSIFDVGYPKLLFNSIKIYTDLFFF